MKKVILFLFVFFNFSARAQWVSIPDTNFGKWLNTSGYAACLQGNSMIGWQLDTTCPTVVNAINVSLSISTVIDLTGIQYFKNLQYLNCSLNKLSNIPSLPNGITHLYLENNQLDSLPVLPDSLIYFDCYKNHLIKMPDLPNRLIHLDCNYNQLNYLPALPTSLISLDCGYNHLDSLPSLPINLTMLICRENLLTGLPILPSSLTSLSCNNNQLGFLPALPNSLTYLNCHSDSLLNLPPLPNNLTDLYCAGNQLSYLSALPNSLTVLSCENNQLTSLPELPDFLDRCWIYDNPIICLPKLKKIVWLKFQSTLITCLPNYGNVTSSTPALNTLPLCDSSNSNGCETFSSIGEISLSGIFLSPNPATTYLTIQLQQSPSSPTVFQLYDITGRMILQKPLTTQTNTVELSGVSRGMYLYSVLRQAQHDTERVGAGKLVVE